MGNCKNKNKEKLIFLMILLLSLVFFITYILLFSYFKKNEKNIYTTHVEKLSNEYKIIIDGYSRIADLVYQNLILTDPVLEIVNALVTEDDEIEQDKYRDDLHKSLLSIYSNLTQFNFRQLHFHTSNNISLLRFHKPEKYGDDLSGVRYSVEYVNKSKERITGFEEGRIFNGYRNVYPLSYNGKHIGSMELSISMSAVIEQLESSFSQKSQFILLKSVVEKKVFESEQSNYKPWPVNSDFVMDARISPESILTNLLDSDDMASLNSSLVGSRQTNEPFAMKVKNRDHNKILTFLPIRNFEGETVAFIFSMSDDEDIKAHQGPFLIITIAFLFLMLFSILFLFYFSNTNKKIETLIQFDPLTQTYTRKMIFQKLEEENRRYQRYKNSFSIGMIDIDHFKKINDKFGHQTGDSVLVEFTALILSNIRDTDYLGRYGGEEFLLLLPETEAEVAAAVIDKIRRIVENHQFRGVNKITFSAGVSTMSSDIKETQLLVGIADQNLYKAKNNGRNQIYPPVI